VLLPEAGTKPHVYYKGLALFTKCFIGGSVTAVREGIADCLEGARAVLLKDGTAVAEQVTDVYGDFKFDGLEPDSGSYEVSVDHALGRQTVSATLGESVFLGEIVLPSVQPAQLDDGDGGNAALNATGTSGGRG
jgi:hypothetical protein